MRNQEVNTPQRFWVKEHGVEMKRGGDMAQVVLKLQSVCISKANQ